MSSLQPGHSRYSSFDLLRETMAVTTSNERNDNGNSKAVQVASNCFTSDLQTIEQSLRLSTENDEDREQLHQTFNIVNDNKKKKVDDNELFLMSLLPFLRAIPNHRKMAIRHKLQRVFIDEQEKNDRILDSINALNTKLMPPPPVPPPAYNNPAGHIIGPQSIVTFRRVSTEMSTGNQHLYFQNKNYETIAPPNVTITSHLPRPSISSSTPPDVPANIVQSAVANVDYLAASTSYYGGTYGNNSDIIAEAQNGNAMMTSYSGV